MASTGQTPNKHLSQFESTDKPSWLGDYNGDMTKIDSAFAAMQAQIDTLTTQLNAANARITVASTRVVALDHGSSF